MTTVVPECLFFPRLPSEPNDLANEMTKMIKVSHALVTALSTLSASGAACDCQHVYDLGNGFALSHTTSDGKVMVTKDDIAIWSTVPNETFISASSGEDVYVGESGNFNITSVDKDRCPDQDMTSIEFVAWDKAANGYILALKGQLLECGPGRDISADYSASFWVPFDLDNRVAFRIEVKPLEDGSTEFNKVYLTFQSSADEDFYGLGAQASFASLKNHSIPIFAREQGFGRGDSTTQLQNLANYFSGGDFYTTYTAIPHFVSTDRKAFYLSENSTAPAEFDFTDPEAVTVRYSGLRFEGHFLQADSMLDAVGKSTEYTGKMLPLPKWVDDGAVIGIQGGEDKVKQVVKDGFDMDCPIVAVWLQDWTGTRLQKTPTGINISRLWWNWEADQELYPDWPAFVKFLRDKHSVRTLSYVNPFLANVSSKEDGFERNMFEEADQLGLAVQNLSTESTSLIASGPGIDAAILDLTNKDSREWFADIMRESVWEADIAGYMCDFGEYTPITVDTGLADTRSSPLDYHNAYPREWAALQQEIIMDRLNASDAVVFHRSTSMGASKAMNLFWAGDQNIDWERNDGIKSVPAILGHMGICGYAHSHSDIGGYTSTFEVPSRENPRGAVGRSAELLGRWGELAAVSSAVFRSHEGNIPQINVQPYTNESTYDYFAYNTRMFAALGPYRRQVLDGEVAQKGYPLLRLPVLHHPEDGKGRNITESFFLGPDLYVAPVLDPGITSLSVYLPGSAENTYLHVWSGETFGGGGTVEVLAPPGQPAVFVVNGADSPELDKFLGFVDREKGFAETDLFE